MQHRIHFIECKYKCEGCGCCMAEQLEHRVTNLEVVGLNPFGIWAFFLSPLFFPLQLSYIGPPGPRVLATSKDPTLSDNKEEAKKPVRKVWLQ